MGTGSFTHNLKALDRGRLDGPEPQWSREFSDWIHAALTEGGRPIFSPIASSRPMPPRRTRRKTIFCRLFAGLGAGGEGAKPERLHKSTTFGSLRMDAYAFS